VGAGGIFLWEEEAGSKGRLFIEKLGELWEVDIIGEIERGEETGEGNNPRGL